MINVQVSITGLDEAISKFGKLKEDFESLEPELQKVGDYLLDFFTNDVFDSEGSVYGLPWEPLSPRYAAIKGAGQILVRTGKMRASYKLYTSTTYLLIKNEAQNERGDYYAGFHQQGTSRMPQRTLVKFDRERLDRLQKILVDELKNRISKTI